VRRDSLGIRRQRAPTQDLLRRRDDTSRAAGLRRLEKPGQGLAARAKSLIPCSGRECILAGGRPAALVSGHTVPPQYEEAGEAKGCHPRALKDTQAAYKLHSSVARAGPGIYIYIYIYIYISRRFPVLATCVPSFLSPRRCLQTHLALVGVVDAQREQRGRHALMQPRRPRRRRREGEQLKLVVLPHGAVGCAGRGAGALAQLGGGSAVAERCDEPKTAGRGSVSIGETFPPQMPEFN
jgi:hypothetical protein